MPHERIILMLHTSERRDLLWGRAKRGHLVSRFPGLNYLVADRDGRNWARRVRVKSRSGKIGVPGECRSSCSSILGGGGG